MLNFFRRIRRNLANQNKFVQYSRYAIGEIVLVVIGILIALQVNTLNENRKLKAKELKIIQHFENRLNRDLFVTRWATEINNTARSSMGYLQSYMEKDLPYKDTLKFHFGNITQVWGLNVDYAAYEELKSIGVDIISNESLKTNLLDYYSESQLAIRAADVYSKIMEDASKTIFPNHFNQRWNTTSEFQLGKVPVVEMIPVNYEQLKKDKKFRYFLKSLENENSWLIELSLERSLEKNTNLLSEIEIEIEKLNK